MDYIIGAGNRVPGDQPFALLPELRYRAVDFHGGCTRPVLCVPVSPGDIAGYKG
jgi:hypothetical protein